MLIPLDTVIKTLANHNINITGIFHLGAHECEELDAYSKLGVSMEDIVWVDAIHRNTMRARHRGIPNVYTAVITDKDNDTVSFNISNNVQSSSVLEFDSHTTEHPHIHFIDSVEMETTTVNTFFDTLPSDCTKYNFWNFDIQGAELMALQGSLKYLPHVAALYLEVNEKSLYKGCALIGDIDEFLSRHGFQRIVTEMTQYGWGDAIYIKSATSL